MTSLTDELRGSIPLQATNMGLVVQLVRISACHAEGREFESRPDRKREKSSIGRASVFQTEGCEFDSHFSLKCLVK